MRIRKIINVSIIVAVAGAWLTMTYFGSGALSETGLRNLRFFTIQSNLFAALAAAVWLAVSGGSEGSRRAAEKLKYMAAAAVGLTFTVVMVFLGPLYGYPLMFAGPNLFLHLLVPLAAIAEIIFLSDTVYTARDNALAVIPPLLYGTVYLLNNFINGVGEWPDTNDWYLFLRWGYPVGMAIFMIICVITWLIGLLMRKCSAARRRRTE